MAMDFSTAPFKIRKQSDSFNITKENEFWSRILYPAKGSMKIIYQARLNTKLM